jgi:hypothetical protein
VRTDVTELDGGTAEHAGKDVPSTIHLLYSSISTDRLPHDVYSTATPRLHNITVSGVDTSLEVQRSLVDRDMLGILLPSKED